MVYKCILCCKEVMRQAYGTKIFFANDLCTCLKLRLHAKVVVGHEGGKTVEGPDQLVFINHKNCDNLAPKIR